MSTKIYKEALQEVLRCERLDVAKEIAAEALGVDIEAFEEDTLLIADEEEDHFKTNFKDVLSMFE